MAEGSEYLVHSASASPQICLQSSEIKPALCKKFTYQTYNAPPFCTGLRNVAAKEPFANHSSSPDQTNISVPVFSVRGVVVCVTLFKFRQIIKSRP